MRKLNRLVGIAIASALAMSCSIALAQDKPAAKPEEKKPAAAKPDEKKPAAAKPDEKGGAPSEAEMMAQMMELAKLNENHKLLAGMAGDWTFTTKFWQDPSAPPDESKGTTVITSVMEGRFFKAESKGTFQMPGPDGKPQDMQFHGIGLTGYDNVKKKFVNTWIDNMGTGIMMSEGTYDAATKSFTYTADVEFMPGMKCKIREVIRIIDNDHHVFEWYETRGTDKEMKTMEITYTRKK